MLFSYGLLVSNGQVKIRPPCPRLLAPSMMGAQPVPDVLAEMPGGTVPTSSSAVLPSAADRSAHQARNCVVSTLTGRPVTKRSQMVSVSGRSSPWQANALGSASSWATVCAISRSGRSGSVQVSSVGWVSRLHQVSFLEA